MPATVEEQDVREVPIGELIARHPGQQGLRLMTIRAYFDGSGKSRDPNVRCVALAGYVGTEGVWGEFQGSRWEQFKKDHGINYFHASELEAAQGDYYGYTPARGAMVRAGLTELLRDFNKKDFSAVAYSVSMIDYRALAGRPLPTPEEICGSGALDDLCTVVPVEHELQVFYDRGESFLTRLQDRWRSKKARAADPRLNRISVFSQVDDWRKYPALQAADYLAWCIAKGDEFGLDLRMLTTDLALYGKHYDGEELERLKPSLWSAR
jgi:hypothetical protein